MSFTSYKYASIFHKSINCPDLHSTLSQIIKYVVSQKRVSWHLDYKK